MYQYSEFLKYGITIPEDKVPNATGNIHVICPECSKSRIHREKAHLPVLGVHVQKGAWRCNNCGWTGSINKTINVDEKFKERVRGININYEYDINHKIVQWFWEKRKIGIDTLRKNRVFFAEQYILIKKSSNNANVGKTMKTLCINYPFYEDGLVVNLKFRDSNKNFGAIPGGRLTFYGIDDINNDDWCIIVEGENDKLAWSEVGIQNCMSVPNGAQISDDERKRIINNEVVESHMNLEYVDNCIDKLQHIKRFIIATDNDPAGIKLRNELARRLGKSRCCYITFNNYKDSNDLLVAEGQEALKKQLEDPNDFPIDNIIFAKDVYADLEYEFIHGKQKGKSSGWKSLDNHFSLRFGDFIVGNGYAGMGKTTFMLNLLCNTAVLYDWKWGLYCPENYPERRVFDIMAEILVGNTSDKDFINRMTLAEYKRIILGFLQKHIYLVRGHKRYSPKEVNDKAGEMISKLGIVGFVKDPWNALKHNLRNRSIDDYLEDALSDEVEFATKNEIMNLVIAHPPTPSRDKVSNLSAPPMFQIRGGTIWANKAYVIFCIHQRNLGDVRDSTVEFHLQKSKDHKTIGYITKEDDPVLLTFKYNSNRFYELNNTNGGTWDNPLERNKSILTEQLKLIINE